MSRLGINVAAARRAPSFPESVFGNVILIESQDSVSAQTLVSYLTTQENFRSVQLNSLYSVDSAGKMQPDEFADSLGHLSVIGLNIQSSARGDGVVVGLIDTGIYFDHPDLVDNIYTNTAEDLDGNGRITESDFNGIDDDGNGFIDDVAGYDFLDRKTAETGDYRSRDPDASDDGSGHGTAVAGVVGATAENVIGIRGVAPQTQLMPLRAFGRDGRGTDLDVAAAIVYAAENGADILNLSFGNNYFSPLVRDAIQYAVSNKVVVVASAGNLGGDAPHYPSDYPDVISVVWLNQQGSGISSRGTHGVGVDLGAPGSSVFTTLMPESVFSVGDSQYGRLSGSSISAPMVSAAAAILRGIEPDLTPNDVRALLVQSATDIDSPGWDHRTGAGNLNVDRAIGLLAPAIIELASPTTDSGYSDGPIPIVGTVSHPSLQSYRVDYVMGTEDLESPSWTNILSGDRMQFISDTLGFWDISAVGDGDYTLRLVAQVADAQDIENRYRIFIDRTGPQIESLHIYPTLTLGGGGVFVDLKSDDAVDASMIIGGATVKSDRVSRRQGLAWESPRQLSDSVSLTLTLQNRSGLFLQIDTLVQSSTSSHIAPDLFNIEDLEINGGFLLNKAVDMDGDGLPEVYLNRFENGVVGDTLRALEFDGSSFRTASSLIANVIPRDVGDTDGDGFLELVTQVGAATIIFEQSGQGEYPATPIYVDTTGLANPLDPLAVWGALLEDVDGDGRDELVSHNGRQFRLFDNESGVFVVRDVLTNPTGVDNSEVGEDLFGPPKAEVGDLDGDGKTDLLVGDTDGDLILFESEGAGFQPVWSFETDRYNAGDRFAVGDVTGDGRPDLIAYVHNWLTITSDGFREPDLGILRLFSSDSDNSLVPVGTIGIPGEISRNGSIAVIDVDNDQSVEIVVSNSPDLFVLDWVGEALVPIFRSPLLSVNGVRSPEMAVSDFDNDGVEEILFSTGVGSLAFARLRSSALDNTTPVMLPARFQSSNRVNLSWLHGGAGADSTTVYSAVPSQPFTPIATTSDNTLSIDINEPTEFAVVAWRGGNESQLSASIFAVPHPIATLSGVSITSNRTLNLTFTQPMQIGVGEQILVNPSGDSLAGRLLLVDGGKTISSTFGDNLEGTVEVVAKDLVDHLGGEVADTSIVVSVDDSAAGGFHVQSWRRVDSQTLDVEFSLPVALPEATDLTNYTLEPHGTVESVTIADAQNTIARISFSGVALAPTGINLLLTIEGLRSESGLDLRETGNTIRLTDPAGSIQDAYVFPNPLVVSRDGSRLTIAGVPVGSRVQIIGINGTSVIDRQSRDASGAFVWDLVTDPGNSVPSGLYIVRVTDESDESSVTLKAIIIN